jgi:hypothetical protein
MNVEQLSKTEGFRALAMPKPEREITGVYIGDLLSWVMGRAKEGDAWITIMSNNNIVAVATLADIACIILAEGVTLDKSVFECAMSKGINILSSLLPAYETAMAIRSSEI